MKISFSLLFCWIASVLLNSAYGLKNDESEESNPVVECSLGIARGNYYKSVGGRKYAAFEGIPYAQPPLKKLRFQEPKPIKRWHGVLEARFLRTCIQYNHYKHHVLGEEDCLHLNVYSPQPNRTAGLDVIVFIHGGAFMFGAGDSYGERILMNRNVVYVTLNYRLGPFGFLSTEDQVVPGNNGLKDQVLALKWIKKNIIHFGGNPNSITLTGMSAGGASVHLHYMSPLSKGLFARGFSQSGTALNPWVLQENALSKARQLAALLGCETKNGVEEMVNCLRYIPAQQITQAVPHFFAFLYNPFSPFGVVIEPANTPNAFLNSHPYEILSEQGRVQSLPWLTSVVHSEGLYPASEFVADPVYLKTLDSEWASGRILGAQVLDFNYTVELEQKSVIAEEAKEFYLKKEKISYKTFNQLVQMVGDRLFVSDSGLAARMQAKTTSSPVYYYQFNYRGAHSKSETLSKTNEDFGASHGDDAIYVLSSNVNSLSTEMDRRMSEVLVDLWISYARNGVPTIMDKTWKSVSSNDGDSLNYMQISSPDNVTEQVGYNFGNSDFWHKLPFKENRNLFVDTTKDEL